MGGSPFGSSLQDLQNNWMQQYTVAQQMQQVQNPAKSVLDEINKEISSLGHAELEILVNVQEYQMAKQTYEAGFMSFLGLKFSSEYINTPDGKVAADNLLKSIQKAKETASLEVRNKQEKMNMMISLLENDPDIRKKYDEMLINKQL